MTTAARRLILRTNAVYLGVAAITGLVLTLDLPRVFFASFLEAHGLAFIFAVLLWQTPPVRYAHVVAAAVQSLLAAASIVFWPVYVALDMTVGGAAITAAHLVFAALQLLAASGPRARAAVQ
jgi:hypothetical protein